MFPLFLTVRKWSDGGGVGVMGGRVVGDGGVSLAELAAHCDRSERTVRRWVRDGHVRVVRQSDGGVVRLVVPHEEFRRVVGLVGLVKRGGSWV